MKAKIKFALMFLLYTLIIACGNTDEFYTVEMVDGVQNVHNNMPLWGDEPKLELEFVQKIGGLDVTDENYLLFRPTDVAVDSKGDVFVLDAGNNRIQKYSSDGEFLLSFGNEGQGPGELINPSTIEFNINGDIYISNTGNLRIEVYDSQGNVKNSLKPGPYIQNFLLLSSGEFVINSNISKVLNVETNEQFYELIKSEPYLLEIYSKDGDLKRQLGKQRIYDTFEFQMMGNEFFYCADRNDNIYTSFKWQNRIEKFNTNGELLLTIDRQLGFPESSNMDKQEKQINGRTETVSVINVFSMGIEVDNMDRIWTATLQNQPDYNNEMELDQNSDFLALEVYNNDGVLLQRLPYPQSWMSELKLIYKNRLFFVDGMKEMAVYEYKIVEK